MHKLRSLVPQAARERLYAWHPGRARRWTRFPGLERLTTPSAAVLTFDDGPDEDATLAVLDALDLAGARATFFFVGEQLRRYPSLGREVIARGHEVGLHGDAHVRHDRVDRERSRTDIIRGRAQIEDVLGLTPRWFRPPYGKMSEATAHICTELDLTLVYWSAWGLDWEEVGPTRIVQVAAEELDGGGILLLHDSARFARRTSAAPTAEAIQPLTQRLRDKGLALVTLGEAIAA